jgi:hypothetical protein
MAINTLFASATVKEHLIRGGIGISAWMLAFKVLAFPSWLALGGALLLIILAMVAMRGCPVCWSFGMLNTARNGVCPIPAKAKK